MQLRGTFGAALVMGAALLFPREADPSCSLRTQAQQLVLEIESVDRDGQALAPPDGVVGPFTVTAAQAGNESLDAELFDPEHPSTSRVISVRKAQ